MGVIGAECGGIPRVLDTDGILDENADMSRSYVVTPSLDYIPTFNELLAKAAGHLNDFVGRIGISTRFSLTVELRQNTRWHERIVLPIDLNGVCCWTTEQQLAWFGVDGFPGGSDAWTRGMSDLRRKGWQSNAKRRPELAACIDRMLRVGRAWSFFRSMNQSPIICVTYGLLAGSLAELTDGIVDSCDSWGISFLPVTAGEFLRRYLSPEHVDDACEKAEAVQLLNELKEQLQASKS
jgi:hypothetical protein